MKKANLINEKKELTRLKKMQSRSSGSKYFLILLCLIAAYSLVTYCDAKFEAGDYKKDSYIDVFCFEVQ